MKLDGAVCLVSGCSTGIGRATAVELHRRGAVVHAGSRTPGALAGLAGDRFRPVHLDVTSERSVQAAVAGCRHVDALVANAGYAVVGAVEEVSDDDLRAQYDVNVFGLWRMCRAVLPAMRARRSGAIVGVSSFGGQVPFPGIGAYRTSKFAVEGLLWTLRLEVAQFGIDVLSVQPGLTESAFESSSRPASGYQERGPYASMRAQAAAAYPRMSPAAQGPDAVARAICDAIERPPTAHRLRVGEDAERVMAIADQGPEAYERWLEETIGLDWRDGAFRIDR